MGWKYKPNSNDCRLNLASGTSNLKEKHSPLSCSIPSLSPSANGCTSTMSELLPPPTTFAGSADLSCLMSSTDYVQEFLHGAQDLIECFSSVLRVLNHERERLKLVTEAASETTSISSRSGAPPGTFLFSRNCYLRPFSLSLSSPFPPPNPYSLVTIFIIFVSSSMRLFHLSILDFPVN